jgi:hypothetical protein
LLPSTPDVFPPELLPPEDLPLPPAIVDMHVGDARGWLGLKVGNDVL